MRVVLGAYMCLRSDSVSLAFLACPHLETYPLLAHLVQTNIYTPMWPLQNKPTLDSHTKTAHNQNWVNHSTEVCQPSPMQTVARQVT